MPHAFTQRQRGASIRSGTKDLAIRVSDDRAVSYSNGGLPSGVSARAPLRLYSYVQHVGGGARKTHVQLLRDPPSNHLDAPPRFDIAAQKPSSRLTDEVACTPSLEPSIALLRMSLERTQEVRTDTNVVQTCSVMPQTRNRSLCGIYREERDSTEPT